MKTNIYNESKNRNATATELARNIMNSAVECAIESAICDFQADPKYCGEGLAQLNEDQKQAVLEAMKKISDTLWPKTGSDHIYYQ